jgi:hypothetical protein
MALNITRRRAAKAVRRKDLLKTRRAATKPASLAERVRRLATRPIHRCLIQPEMFETGMGTVVLARRTETGEIAMAAFLVDTFSLGIKDVVFQTVEPSEFEAFMAMGHEAAPFCPVDPSYARKLLRDAAAFAASLGLRPHRGFGAIEQLFGDVRAADCTEHFAFGREGKPVYMVGPSETTEQVVRRLGRLADHLGPDGFEFVIPVSEEECITNAEAEPVVTPALDHAVNDA